MRYEVRVPITGVIALEVEAENKKDAIDKAFESEDLKLENIDGWDVHECIVDGNVSYAYQNSIDVVEI